MKWLFGILGVAGAGFLGYVAEPSLRESLTGISASTQGAPVADASVEESEPAPEPEPEPVAVEVPAVDSADPMADADPMTPPPADEPAAEEPTPELPDAPEPAPESEMADAGEGPEPEVEEPQAEPAAEAGPTDVVEVMKASIRNTEIKEFGFDQVQSWEAAEDEDFEGSTHQVGMLSYTAETMFGKKTMQAKAYIKDGKVQRWVWPTSGMEIE